MTTSPVAVISKLVLVSPLTSNATRAGGLNPTGSVPIVPVIGASPIMKVLSAVDCVENVDVEQSRLDLVEEEHAMSAVSSSEGVVAASLPRLASDVRFIEREPSRLIISSKSRWL